METHQDQAVLITILPTAVLFVNANTRTGDQEEASRSMSDLNTKRSASAAFRKSHQGYIIQLTVGTLKAFTRRNVWRVGNARRRPSSVGGNI